MKLESIDEANKKQTRSKAICEVFKEFCSKSSIHGVRYFAEKRWHWTERAWWIIAFSLSVWLCGLSIQNIWSKWEQTPVTKKFTEKDSSISNIPFPTVTICPETKVYKTKLNITHAYHMLKESPRNLSDIEIARMEAVSHICQFYFEDGFTFGSKLANLSIYGTILDLAPSFNETMFRCAWQYKNLSCSKLFVPILTEEGLCFAFNALNSREMYTEEMAPEMMTVSSSPNMSHWTLDDGYDDGRNEQEYPIRMFNAKQNGALVLFLVLHEHDLDYICRGAIQGFKIILSTPGEVFKMSQHSFRVPLAEQADISIKPSLVSTSDILRRYTPEQRKCYFTSERPLQFFKSYALHNCELECLANYTKQECGCVKFSMPRKRNTNICGSASLNCYESAEKKLFGEDIIDGLDDKDALLFRQNCNCLPACTTMIYDAEIDRAKYDWEATIRSYKQWIRPGTKPATVTISFRSTQMVKLMREEQYTNTDFLAICGGLLGLFLGVSALSIIEFLYYVTIRLFWTLKQWKFENIVTPTSRKIPETRIVSRSQIFTSSK